RFTSSAGAAGSRWRSSWSRCSWWASRSSAAICCARGTDVRGTRILTIAGLAVFLLIVLVPFWWIATMSFKTYDQIQFAVSIYVPRPCTWLMIGFFKALPRELEEAAFVDGATRTTALVRILLPLAAPGIVASAIFAFTLSWNEFLYALVFIQDETKLTVPVGLNLLIYG